MKTIYKYDITNDSIVKMPISPQLLSVQMQGNKIMLWALVDTGVIERNYHVYIFGTGHEIPKELTKADYLDTVQDGEIVLHVFFKF